MATIKIFATQRIDKNSILIQNDIITPVRCGAVFDKREAIDIIGDNEGDNISHKRMSYCELTTQYWAWKNVVADYYGFCHYRRYFSFNDVHFDTDNWMNVVRLHMNETTINELYTTENQIKKRVLGYDVIMPTVVDLKALGIKSVYEQYKNGHYLQIQDLDLILDIIKKKYPEYQEAAKKYINGDKAYFYNMFIMKKDIFFSYSQWLFDILEEFENTRDMSLYSEESFRTPGHLGERLLGIYITWLRLQNKYKIGELQVMTFLNTDIIEHPSPAFMENNIPIVFSSSEYFLPYCATAIQSVMQHASTDNNYDFIILEREVSIKNKQLMKRMLSKYPNASVRFINVSHIVSNYSLHICEHFAVETYFRLLIPELLPDYDKVLYLDGDIIAKTDIADLFNTDIGDNAIAAAIDVIAVGHINGFPDGKHKIEYYKRRVRLKDIHKQFNGGVMLINCKRIRTCYSMDELLQFAQASKFDLADQDCLVSLFQDEIYWLDLRWNVNIYDTNSLGYYVASFAPRELFAKYKAAMNNPKILHYAGTTKPWHDPSHILAEEFWLIARQTPFYETILYRRILENVHHSTNMLRNELKTKRNKKTSPPQETRSLLFRVAGIFFPLYSRRRELIKNIYYSVTGKPRPS